MMEGAVADAPQELYDFNFDGHEDYRVKMLEYGKADFYDVHLFSPKLKRHARSKTLSFSVNPLPNPELKEVHCVHPGGHSGMLFSMEVYRWDSLTQVRLHAYVRQDEVTFGEDGHRHYVRATTEMKDGKPVRTDMESVPYE
jgi:hypothetical protein